MLTYRVIAGSIMLWGINRAPHQTGEFVLRAVFQYTALKMLGICARSERLSELMRALGYAALHPLSCRRFLPFSGTGRMSAGCRLRQGICRASLEEHSQLVFQELLLFVFQQACLLAYPQHAFHNRRAAAYVNGAGPPSSGLSKVGE